MVKYNMYSSETATNVTLDCVFQVFKRLGVNRIVYKNLSPNDNSKNQPYLAGDFADLGFLPTGELIPSQTTSKKVVSLSMMLNLLLCLIGIGFPLMDEHSVHRKLK